MYYKKLKVAKIILLLRIKLIRNLLWMLLFNLMQLKGNSEDLYNRYFQAKLIRNLIHRLVMMSGVKEVMMKMLLIKIKKILK